MASFDLPGSRLLFDQAAACNPAPAYPEEDVVLLEFPKEDSSC